MDKKKGLQVRKGKYVLVIPIMWRTSMDFHDPDFMCLSVAKQTFGKGTTLVGLDSELYADGVSLLEQVCAEAGKEFKLLDPVDMVCKVDGRNSYIRIAHARSK